MEGQHQRVGETSKKAAVQSSIKELKKKFVPGVKYGLLISAACELVILIVGCLNVHQCPVNKNIPLFLIATGAIGLMSKFISYVRDRISKHIKVAYFESALYGVETILFILGTYWVYKEYKPSYDPRDGNAYCNKTAYLFAFIYVTLFYAFIIALICGLCCFLCCAICCAAVDSVVEDAEAPSANNETTTNITVSTTINETK